MAVRIQFGADFDSSNFNRGVDGAKAKIGGFEQSLAGVSRTLTGLFSMEVMRRGFNMLVNTVDQVKAFQKERGIKLVSDEQLARLDAVSAKLEMVSLRAKGTFTGWISDFLLGWERLSMFLGKVSAGQGVKESFLEARAFTGLDESGASKRTPINPAIVAQANPEKPTLSPEEFERERQRREDRRRQAERKADQDFELFRIQQEQKEQDAAQRREDLLTARTQDIGQAAAGAMADAAGMSARGIDADTYARIGGQIGSGVNPAVRIADKQLKVTERIAEIEQRMLAEIEKLNSEV